MESIECTGVVSVPGPDGRRARLNAVMVSGIRSAALSDYAGVARDLGLDPLGMVLAMKLPAASLTERDLKLPTDRVCALLEESAQRSGCATFGLELAQHRRLSHLGELGLLLRDLPTVRDVMQATSEFVRFHNASLVYALEQKQDVTHILMENRVAGGKPTRQFSEFVQGSAFRIFVSQFAEARDQLRVCFRHSAPAEMSPYQKFFGHTPVFDHDFNGFVCPISLLDQRNPSADSDFSLYARNLVQARAGSTAARRADDVLRVILQLLPTGRCDAEHIAECLGVDRRTVHRQLLREGKTVSGLIEEVRVELSARYVLASTLPISDLAPMLGFHSTSALVNWYRRRYGMPPSQHRRTHTGHSSAV